MSVYEEHQERIFQVACMRSAHNKYSSFIHLKNTHTHTHTHKNNTHTNQQQLAFRFLSFKLTYQLNCIRQTVPFLCKRNAPSLTPEEQETKQNKTTADNSKTEAVCASLGKKG